jgi:C4-dicarboxylate-specific signal transduction histidine kinase
MLHNRGDCHRRCDTELESNLPRVAGDQVRLQRVLMNPIMNALEAMQLSTEPSRKLWIRSAKSTDGISVQVQDSGARNRAGVGNSHFRTTTSRRVSEWDYRSAIL